MTLITAPVTVTTTDGATLPLVALPQSELVTVNQKNIPLVKGRAGPRRALPAAAPGVAQGLGDINHVGGGAAGFTRQA